MVNSRPLHLLSISISVAPWLAISAAMPCTVCSDGSSFPTLPDVVVHIPPLPAVTCDALVTTLPVLLPDETKSECELAQAIAGNLCGCPRRSDGCNLCPDGSSVIHKDKELPAFGEVLEDSDTLFTCKLLEAYLKSEGNTDTICSNSQKLAAQDCGCPVDEFTFGGENNSTTNATDTNSTSSIDFRPPSFDKSLLRVDFFGAENSDELSRLFTISRAAAILSIVAALLVIQDTCRSKQRRANMYNQIVSVMAGFDIIYSISLSLGDIPSPADDVLETPSEMGNDATCKAQGWFSQWGGMSSLFLNATLSTYYVLVIVYRARSSRLKALRIWLLGVPICLGLIVACASLPFITNFLVGCLIPPPFYVFDDALGRDATWGPFFGLYLLPGFSALLYTTVSLFVIYRQVASVNKKANKWRLRLQGSSNLSSATSDSPIPRWRFVLQGPASSKKSKSKSDLRSEVAFQSAMYLGALYLSWFIYLIVSANMDTYAVSHYELWAVISFIMPLQGFTNACIYFRPRFARAFSKHLQSQRNKRLQKGKMSSQEIVASQGRPASDQSVNRWQLIREAEPANELVEMNESGDDSCAVTQETEMAGYGCAVAQKIESSGDSGAVTQQGIGEC